MSDDFEQRDLDAEKRSTSTSNSDALSNTPSNDFGETDEERDPFEELASEFSERYRNGEMPSVEEYVERFPELAEEIRDLFPTIAAMEQLKERKAPAKPAEGGLELEQLGDFRILGEIGRGGMGVVYEAEQVSLGRHVAVKVLPKQALLDERHLRRFEREAQTAAKLHHTNIVPVFGVGQQDGFHYIVMQFIPGVGLDEILIALRTMVLDDDAAAYRADSSSRASHANHNAKALLEGNFNKHATTNFASSFTKVVRPVGSGTTPIGGTDATMELSNAAEISSAAAEAVGRSGFSIASGSSASGGSEPSSIKSLDEDNSRVLASLDREYYQSVAKIGQQVADALAYAHEQGTLHRDIKPGNLLLDGTGTVWVADFGLAKLAEQDNVSRTGDLVGTLSYMPPESFSGETDGRGDIYALGLTLYEMLALRPAYFGRDRAKLVKKITEGDLPRLSKLNPSVPRDLETIVLKAIAHQPEDRYASARELEEDMQSFLTDMPIKARRMSLPEQFTRWCRKNKMVASLSAAVLSLLLISSISFGVLYDNAEDQRQIAEAQRKIAIENKDTAEKNERLADNAREEADTARKEANEIATLAIGELFKRFNDIFSERLPLSTDQSLAVALSDESTETLNDNEGDLDQPNLNEDDLTQDQSFATVTAKPVTTESAIQAEKYLESFEVLATRTLKADEFAPIFADLTIRVGKIQRLLGHNTEALEKFDSGIAKYEAIVESNPSPSAIIGLANSYNEKGDVIALTSRDPREAFETFDKARKLFEEHADELADSPRATYERARMLFLMSMQYRASFGGPGGGPGGGGGQGRGRSGRGGGGGDGPGGQRGERAGRGGSRRGGGEGRDNQPRESRENRGGFGGRERSSRIPRLKEAIGLLEKLVENESNPEYRYLLARCHTAVALNSSWREREQRSGNSNKALSLLQQLVEEQPSVADYGFEFAIATFIALEVEHPPMPEQEKRIGEIVKLTTKITTENPAISNYAFVHLRALTAHVETLDQMANDAERKGDDNLLELRTLAEEKATLALNASADIQTRFPKNTQAMASRIPTPATMETLQQFASVKRMIAETQSLYRENKENEALATLTSARNTLRKITDRQVENIDFRRPSGPRLFESMKMLCAMEEKISGKEAVETLLRELTSQRLAVAKASTFPESTKSSVAEIQLYAGHILEEIGARTPARNLFSTIRESLEPLVSKADSFKRPKVFTEETRAKMYDAWRAVLFHRLAQNAEQRREFVEQGTRGFGRGSRGPGPERSGRPGPPNGRDGDDPGPPEGRGPGRRESGGSTPPSRPQRPAE